MNFSYQDLSIFMLYFVTVIVTGVSEHNVDLQRKDSHERKAIPLHKSRPLPDHDEPTTSSSSTTTLTDTVPSSKLTTDMTDATAAATEFYTVTDSVTSSKLTTDATATTTVIFTTQSNVTTSHTANASEPTLPTTAPTFHPITAPPNNDSCQFKLEEYGRLSSNFTNCAIVHAKPFLFCENCVKEYVVTVEAYNTITADEGENKCKDSLLFSDRVMIVNQLHLFVLNLWDDGNCDSCFEDVNDCKANRTCSLSLDTRKFMDTYQETMKCFNQYEAKNGSLVLDVCSNCSHTYNQLNERYEETGPLDDTCMDIVELMNHTRIKWSSDLKCIQFKKDVGSVVALGIFIGLLPLFFYCGVRVHAEKQTRRYMRQKRLSYAQPNIQSPNSRSGMNSS
ncbi:osteopetrosis-associated transmembrane protein 1-like [Amphiura filiformis]|uniref:osteopetrosis-associated transmembrane protein 1-like n=1 Tax=Amphiura filiformis TaxID=82378 RepID=UPI003B2260EB